MDSNKCSKIPSFELFGRRNKSKTRPSFWPLSVILALRWANPPSFSGKSVSTITTFFSRLLVRLDKKVNHGYLISMLWCSMYSRSSLEKKNALSSSLSIFSRWNAATELLSRCCAIPLIESRSCVVANNCTLFVWHAFSRAFHRLAVFFQFYVAWHLFEKGYG